MGVGATVGVREAVVVHADSPRDFHAHRDHAKNVAREIALDAMSASTRDRSMALRAISRSLAGVRIALSANRRTVGDAYFTLGAIARTTTHANSCSVRLPDRSASAHSR